jgi:capsular polysaccharide biosynthesis protein
VIAMMDSASQENTITAPGRLTARPAAALVPALTQAEFAAGQAGHIEAIGAGEMALPPVACHGVSPREVDIQRPLKMPAQPPGFLDSVRFPRLTISRLRDAVCVQGGIAIAAGQTVLLESFSAPWEADYHNELVRDGEGWRLRHAIDAASVLDGPTLFVDYQHSAFFGHFIADSLSRCWAVEFCRAWLRTDIRKVLITEPVPAFTAAMLGALGIWTIPLRAGQAVRCRELIVATKAFQLQEYVAPPAIALWQRLRDRLAVAGDWPARVFISRRRNPTRKLCEEDQVETLFATCGFTIFRPEEHDIATQISVFAAARLIAGCSGSNMFNIAFQRNAAAVLILVSPLLVHYSEHFLNVGGRARISYFPGHVTAAQMALTPGYVHAPWPVDMAALKTLVAEWLAGAD